MRITALDTQILHLIDIYDADKSCCVLFLSLLSVHVLKPSLFTSAHVEKHLLHISHESYWTRFPPRLSSRADYDPLIVREFYLLLSLTADGKGLESMRRFHEVLFEAAVKTKALYFLKQII